jgi:uncharacterized Ntn-hydrolase superfamily protein
MTYSIAAHCPDTGAFGIAITSSSICVASRCAWVGPVGAVLTQNVTDPQLGPAGLYLLRRGLGAAAVVQQLVAGTPDPAWRQVAAVDRYGAISHHSGSEALPKVAVAEGEGCIAMGNLLATTAVADEIIASFRRTGDEPLAERLMQALEAGLAAGGETGDEHAAGLHVARHYDWPLIDLRVDWHDRPIAALRDLWERYRPEMDAFLGRARSPATAPSF